MPSLNSVSLIGHLGQDPEVRYAKSGAMICSFTMATSKNRKTKEGEWEETTTWHTIKAFAKTAEYFAERAKKGDLVGVQGELENESWTGNDGVEKKRTVIIAHRVQNYGRRQSPGNDGQPHARSGKGRSEGSLTAARATQGQAPLDNEDDIPF